MTKFTWRRSHGVDIVAEVQVDGRGLWQASAWLRSNQAASVRAKTARVSRQAACAKADELARDAFDHVCQMTTCGEWLPYDVSSKT